MPQNDLHKKNWCRIYFFHSEIAGVVNWIGLLYILRNCTILRIIYMRLMVLLKIQMLHLKKKWLQKRLLASANKFWQITPRQIFQSPIQHWFHLASHIYIMLNHHRPVLVQKRKVNEHRNPIRLLAGGSPNLPFILLWCTGMLRDMRVRIGGQYLLRLITESLPFSLDILDHYYLSDIWGPEQHVHEVLIT